MAVEHKPQQTLIHTHTHTHTHTDRHRHTYIRTSLSLVLSGLDMRQPRGRRCGRNRLDPLELLVSARLGLAGAGLLADPTALGLLARFGAGGELQT